MPGVVMPGVIDAGRGGKFGVMSSPTTPLTLEDRIQLADRMDQIIESSDQGWTVPLMEGYFMALATAPEASIPDEWMEEAIPAAVLEPDLAKALTQDVLRLYNDVVTAFADPASEWLPLYAYTDEFDTVHTALGFSHGMEVHAGDLWEEYCSERPKIVKPILKTASIDLSDEGINKRTFANAEKDLFASIYQVYVDFAPARGQTIVTQPITAEVTPGRNEPCPCGSGKKYKNCHGRT